MTRRLQFHPACLQLPKMAAHEYQALKASIRQGWDKRYPVLTHENKILDGRHRYLACVELGIAPTFVKWDRKRCEGNPFRFVWSEHDSRRNWQSAEQRQLCWNRTEEAAREWDVEQHRIQQQANKARSEAAKENISRQDRDERGRVKPSEHTNSVLTRWSTPSSNKGAKAKAEKAGTNRGAVQRAAKIEKLAKELGKPEIIDKVAAGDMKAHAALKFLEEEARKRQLQRPVAVELPTGLHRGDFRVLAKQIPDHSVELVFTDPPYDAASVPLYEAAAKVAARILKRGGSFIAYSGQRHLPQVLQSCGKHLAYWWTIAGVHGGSKQILQKLGIRCGWKPLVWFVKGGRGDVRNVLLDVVTGSREKADHPWQQAEEEALYYIEHLTSRRGLVVDFFLGGGTTAVAARKLGRSFIGFEIDAAAIERTAKRLRGKKPT